MKTINDLLREQEGRTPIIDIMGNPTRKIFNDPMPESTAELSFGAFLKETLDKVIKTLYNYTRILKK